MAFTGYALEADVQRIDRQTLERFDGDTGVLSNQILADAKRVNELLDPKLPVPVPRNPDGTYDAALVEANAYLTVAAGNYRVNRNEAGDRARDWALEVIRDINTGVRALQYMVTLDELGIGAAVPGESNTGSGRFELDTLTGRFTGQYRVDYVVEVTKAGASGTAEYKVTKDATELSTGNVTTDTWATIELGVKCRFVGGLAGSFAVGDTWSFVCLPRRQGTTAGELTSVPVRSTW